MTADIHKNQWPNKEKLLSEQQFSELVENLTPYVAGVLAQEKIYAGLLSQLENTYLPLAAWVAQKHTDKPVVIGLNGAQGSGKSTLNKILQVLLSRGFGKSVITISIDDLYLSREDRKVLATKIHPLLQVRGVPGTHNVTLGKRLISSLKENDSDFPLFIPVFDKAQDDLLEKSEWIKVTEQADIILFEGWCVGARPQAVSELEHVINELEQHEDAQGTWRHYVNEQLAGPYQELFSLIDYLVMLKVPDMQSVFEWRCLQEEKLKESWGERNVNKTKIMSEADVSRFIMHYERITRAVLQEMPDRADVVMSLDKQHQIAGIRVPA